MCKKAASLSSEVHDDNAFYGPSFSGTGNCRPQWGQMTVSPACHGRSCFFAVEHAPARSAADRRRTTSHRVIFLVLPIVFTEMGRNFGKPASQHTIMP
jgi:hypothetical protein